MILRDFSDTEVVLPPNVEGEHWPAFPVTGVLYHEVDVKSNFCTPMGSAKIYILAVLSPKQQHEGDPTQHHS